jgi:hypothetical protein
MVLYDQLGRKLNEKEIEIIIIIIILIEDWFIRGIFVFYILFLREVSILTLTLSPSIVLNRFNVDGAKIC